MPLNDDPKLLGGPLRFARKVNKGKLDTDEAKEKLPGLLTFAKTFAAVLLDKEFDTSLGGFPTPARQKAAEVASRLHRDPDASEATVLLVTAVVDICDFEIDHEETYGDEDEDQDEYHDGILLWVGRLLDRFADWIEPGRLPELIQVAIEARDEFAAASAKLES